MIGQYLSNTNEKVTVSILQNILKLNKARGSKSNVAGKKTPFQTPIMEARHSTNKALFSYQKKFVKFFRFSVTSNL